MIPHDDELVQDFVAECREHLADIETQLLALEQGGSQVDQELINKVFRAAHSIKGGAGLLNLGKLKDLAHRTENVLGQVRSGALSPSPEVVNILLLAFDRLRDLVNNLAESESMDIDDVAVALTGLTSSSLPPERKHTLAQDVEVRVSERPAPASVRASAFDLDHAKSASQNVYLLEFELPADAQRAEQSPLELLESLGSHGSILDCTVVPYPGADQASSSCTLLHVLFATARDEAEIRRVPGPHLRNCRRVDAHTALLRGGFAAPEPPPVPRLGGSPSPLPAPHVSEPPPPASRLSSPPAADPLLNAHGAGLERPDAAPKSGEREGGRDTTLRVNVALLESLMNLAGDLVLSRNQLNNAIASGDLDAIRTGSQRMSGVTSELQQAIVQTRLQPIGNLLNKVRRIVRDLGQELDKQIRLEISGSEVEMDKAIIEGLTDALIHMVRNAADHGIGTPEERRSQGKPEVGTLAIRVRPEAGQVVVEVEDDGRGMDARAIAAAAVARGAISLDQVAHLSETDMLALCFMPGVSTTDRVTSLSGRGVGMDVVKSNIDRLSGKIEIESALGVGTLFRMTLPLTLAIIPSLLASVAGERFAIPQVNLVELLRIPAAQAKDRFRLVGQAEVLLLRGELIPVLHLADVLGIERWYDDPARGERQHDRRENMADRRSLQIDSDGSEPRPVGPAPDPDRRTEPDRRYRAASDSNIAIVSAGSFRYGLAVDELHDTLEIVVKPLGRHLKRLREYAGATILGDGAVALILDVNGLAEKSGLATTAEVARARAQSLDEQRTRQAEMLSLLSFFHSPSEPCAVPLAQVKRVEHVARDDIEVLGGRRTIRYRGSSLPLVALHDAAAVGPLDTSQELAVIVFDVGSREVGMLVGRPVDAVEVPAVVDRDTHRQRGILGSVVAKNRTWLIVDLMDLVQAAYPDWLKEQEPTARGARGTVLLAEDSDFFRGQVRKCIEGGGYRVMVAEDGQAAWELLDRGASVDLLVTDIEMPRLSGLQLARRLRGDTRFEGLPIVALSSLAGEDDIANGMAAGVTEYLVKLDSERLLKSVHRLLRASNGARD